MSTSEFLYHVLQVTPLAPQISQILLTPSKTALVYEAGQYATILHADSASSPLSIACAPNKQPMLEFHLHHPVENDKAQDLLTMLTESEPLRLAGPFGACTLSQLKMDEPIIFLAYGTGFAPIKAIIEEIARAKLSPAMHFYWCLADQTALYMSSLIEAWRTHFNTFTFTPIFMSEFAREIILTDHPDLSAFQVYASGPRRLIGATLEAFQEKGLKRARFFSDVA